jgi:hypothetical protein
MFKARNPEDLLEPSVAARIANCSADTIRRRARGGRLECVRTGLGHILIPRRVALALKAEVDAARDAGVTRKSA